MELKLYFLQFDAVHDPRPTKNDSLLNQYTSSFIIPIQATVREYSFVIHWNNLQLYTFNAKLYCVFSKYVHALDVQGEISDGNTYIISIL